MFNGGCGVPLGKGKGDSAPGVGPEGEERESGGGDDVGGEQVQRDEQRGQPTARMIPDDPVEGGVPRNVRDG